MVSGSDVLSRALDFIGCFEGFLYLRYKVLGPEKSSTVKVKGEISEELSAVKVKKENPSSFYRNLNSLAQS